MLRHYREKNITVKRYHGPVFLALMLGLIIFACLNSFWDYAKPKEPPQVAGAARAYSGDAGESIDMPENETKMTKGIWNTAEDTAAQMNQANFEQKLEDMQEYASRTTHLPVLNAEEKRWLDEHPQIRIGYVSDYMPFCGTDDNGAVDGVITDLVPYVFGNLGIEPNQQIRYVSYPGFQEMAEGLKRGEIDLSFPVLGEPAYLEKMGIEGTEIVFEVPMYVAYTGPYSDAIFNRIALNTRPVDIIYKYYSDSELITVKTGEQCLDLVVSGDAGCTIMAAYRLKQLMNLPKYRNFNVMPIGTTIRYGLGVAVDEEALKSQLNKGIAMVDGSLLTDNLFRYIAGGATYSTVDFMRDNLALLLLLLFMVVGTILMIIALYIKNVDDARAELQVQLEENRHLTESQQTQLEQIRKLNESLVIARQAADDANNAKTSFLFNMSHDIRTPMNAIIGFTELVEKYQEDPIKRADYLQKVKNSSAVLLSIINNVLEMARIEKGTIEIEDIPWSMDQFQDSLRSVFGEMMRQKEIDFKQEIRVNHHYIFGDPTKLREVYFNLLSNAFKYTQPGGSVYMKIEEVPGDKEDYAKYVATIRDTGIGMSPEFLPKLFEEFSREKNTTENKIEGTGLGMPIVKKLLTRMGGTIEVESEKNVGTTFTVTISHRIAQKEDIMNQGTTEPEAVSLAGKRLILAEDNELNAEIAMELLTELGLAVDHAPDGEQCVELMKKAPAGFYDLILMDVQMPNMNGYEATKRIRTMAERSKAEIPILAMTANVFEEDKREALRAGMNGHVAKPIDVNQMMREITNALD